MWVRVRASHHGTFVLDRNFVNFSHEVPRIECYLEYLDVFDRFLRSAASVYTGPLVNNTGYIFQRKPGECQIMTRMENENVARANHGLAGKQRVGRSTLNGVRQREDRRIIIRKDFGM